MHPERVQVHVDFEESHWWFVARRRILLRLLRRLLPPGTGRVVVDVGCGTGANIAALAENYRCFGIDPTPAAINAARARFPAVTFICGLAPAAFADLGETPDMVLLMDVIEHVEDDSGFVTNLLDACRPGTLLFITVPAEPRLWTVHDEAFGHYRRYQASTLRALWKDQGVTEVLMSHYNHHLYPVVRAIRCVNRTRGKTSGAADTDFSMPPRSANRILTDVFASEGGTLARALGRPGGTVFQRGVSLVAVLRKDGDTCPDGHGRGTG